MSGGSKNKLINNSCESCFERADLVFWFSRFGVDDGRKSSSIRTISGSRFFLTSEDRLKDEDLFPRVPLEKADIPGPPKRLPSFEFHSREEVVSFQNAAQSI